MYASVEEIKCMVNTQTMVFLTDDDQNEIKEERIIEALKDAESEINGYLQKRYPLPLRTVPAVIKKLCKDIALYNLFSRRGINEDNSVEKTIVDRYKNSTRYLENISKGIVEIGVSAPKPKTEIAIKSNDRVLSRNNLKGM